MPETGRTMRTLIIAAAVLLAFPATAAETLKYDVTFNDQVLRQSETDLTLGDRIMIDDVLLRDGAEIGACQWRLYLHQHREADGARATSTFLLPEGEISRAVRQFAATREALCHHRRDRRACRKRGAGVLPSMATTPATWSLPSNEDPRRRGLRRKAAARDRRARPRGPQGRRGAGRDQGDRHLPHRRVHAVGRRSRGPVPGRARPRGRGRRASRSAPASPA